MANAIKLGAGESMVDPDCGIQKTENKTAWFKSYNLCSRKTNYGEMVSFEQLLRADEIGLKRFQRGAYIWKKLHEFIGKKQRSV